MPVFRLEKLIGACSFRFKLKFLEIFSSYPEMLKIILSRHTESYMKI